MKFRKKPIVIDALQLRWDTWSEMCDFAGVGKLEDGKPEGCYASPSLDGVALGPQPRSNGPAIGLKIPTLEGLMVATEGDWIIRGVKGELYPCRADIFEATYEPVDAGGIVEPIP